MSSLDNNYNILKSIAIKEYASKDSSSNTNIISYLKGLFEFEISSRRVLCHINDLKTLIGILEIRGALSPVNIDVLVYIYSSLKLNEKLLDEHKILIKKDRNCLFTKPYDENTIRPLLSSSIHSCKGTTLNYSSIARNEVPPIYSSILSEKVIKTVCSEIGHSWRSFGRYLKVKEGTIDKIEDDRRIINDEMRAMMILDEYQKNDDAPSEMRLRLLKALRATGRMDIHDKIQKIFLREISS